jgi:carbamoyltransferase
MDSAACLVVAGEIVAAAAEERFSGAKGTGALPVGAMEFCLQQAGVGRDDVDVIAHGFNYDKYRRFFHHTPDYFHRVLSGRTVVDALAENGWRIRRTDSGRWTTTSRTPRRRTSWGFGDALSVVSDGMGEIASLTVYRYGPNGPEELHTQGLKTSLGLLYSIVTRYLGYTFNSDEYKVMGLSAYGDPDRFAPFFAQFLQQRDGAIEVGWTDGALEHGDEGYPDAMAFLEHSLGMPPRRPGTEVATAHADVAAAFQARFTVVLAELARTWLTRTGARDLCLSGGTFLNCLANSAIAELPEVDRVFVPPGAGDDGTATGAALCVSGRPRGRFSVYTGPGYTPDEVAGALENPSTGSVDLLDCGVLSGVTYGKLRGASLDVRYTGIDIGADTIAHCRRLHPEARWE